MEDCISKLVEESLIVADTSNVQLMFESQCCVLDKMINDVTYTM